MAQKDNKTKVKKDNKNMVHKDNKKIAKKAGAKTKTLKEESDLCRYRLGLRPTWNGPSLPEYLLQDV